MKRRLPDRYSKARKTTAAIISLIPPSRGLPIETDPGELIRAALQEALTTAARSGELASFHPLLLEAADRKRRELVLKEKALEATLEKLHAQISYYRNRERALSDALKEPQDLTATDLQRIKAIYGLEEPPALDHPLLDSYSSTD